MIPTTDYIYDLEIYPNVFTASVKHVVSGQRWRFELSHRRNDIPQLIQLIQYLRQAKARMVGFNNVAFDYPILHFILSTHEPTITAIYQLCIKIISAEHSNRFDHVIWDNEQLVPQIDLLKIHHFDNVARFTSLKILEFNMRSKNVQDLPFLPGTVLTDPQIDQLLFYNDHDVDETEAFYLESLPAIAFREELSAKYNRNFLNHNDTKIGKDYFIMELERLLPGSCYTTNTSTGRRMPRQTFRAQIPLREVIFPWIKFKRPEFQAVHQWLYDQVITETKGVFIDIPEIRLGSLAQYANMKVNKKTNIGIAENLNCVVNGFQFDFGTGGIHGSVSSQTVVADDQYEIEDVDVTSFYPSLGIVNRIYPKHLGEQFCDIYKDVFDQRDKIYTKKAHPKINAMLKLALNGVYGDSNNVYSPFYDPQYTMGITINGQLLLCLLADYLMDIPGLQMIQANTDGLTIRYPRTRKDDVKRVTDWWQAHTRMQLEHASYSRMFIRDANNYIAEYTDGKLKRKGAYEWVTVKNGGTLGWHQNHSSLIIPMAAEMALTKNIPIREYITYHPDINDFMSRTKVPRNSKLVISQGGVETLQQNVCRYYITKSGGSFVKIMPPLPKAPDKERRIGIDVGWNVTECNHIDTARRDCIQFEYYIKEAEKLVNPLR